MMCEHCGAELTEAEKKRWDESAMDSIRLGPWCAACWESWGIATVGWQAGVPQPRPTYTEAIQQWRDRAKR